MAPKSQSYLAILSLMFLVCGVSAIRHSKWFPIPDLKAEDVQHVAERAVEVNNDYKQIELVLKSVKSRDKAVQYGDTSYRLVITVTDKGVANDYAVEADVYELLGNYYFKLHSFKKL